MVLKIFGETTASSEPGERSFHDPSSGNDLEADRHIGSFDNFGFQVGQNFLLSLLENWSPVSAIGKEFLQKRKLAEQSSKDQNATITVLDICWMDDGVKQQAYCIDKDVALLALDFFPRIVARRINAGPPFSAPFTL